MKKLLVLSALAGLMVNSMYASDYWSRHLNNHGIWKPSLSPLERRTSTPYIYPVEYRVYATANHLANGQALIDALTRIKVYSEGLGSSYATHDGFLRPTLYLSAGVYDIGDQIVDLCPATYSMIGAPTSRKGFNDLRIARTHKESQGDNNATLIKVGPAGKLRVGPAVKCLFQNIRFLSPFSVSADGKFNTSQTFQNCVFEVDPLSSEDWKVWSDSRFVDCDFFGGIGGNCMLHDAEFQNCYFYGTVGGTWGFQWSKGQQGSTYPYWEAYDFIDCTLLGVSNFTSYADCSPPSMKNCKVNGNGLFSIGLYGSPPFPEPDPGVYDDEYVFNQCEFIETVSGWFPGNTSLTNITFKFCSGVDHALTNTQCRLIMCSDEFGNVLPNQ